MVFSTTIFLFLFLPVTLGVYYLVRDRVRNYWLLLVSVIFFAWSQPHYLWIILLNAAINYVSAMLMQNPKLKKPVLVLCIAANLGVLIYYKYFDFLLQTLAGITGRQIDLLGIILPIGISFFTFQGMSYAIDVYRGDAPVQKNPFYVALYIMLFPQLIAGPIVRYVDVAQEMDQRSVALDDFVYGIQRFVIGLAKKVIVSNTMALVVDSIWANGAGNSLTSVAWVGSIAYALQIYYDFSGYSDMAIGLGRMFGFHFNENFNLPYISRSITEFWRRWHISLSTWFRDYVYIPLGGNRKRVYFNLSMVFLLTGVWHGASWNFILWGIWHGVFMLAERILKAKGHPVKKNIWGLLYTLMVVNIGWVLFRAPNLSDALLYLGNLFGRGVPSGMTVSYYVDNWSFFVGIVGIVFASDLPGNLWKKLESRISGNTMTMVMEVGKYVALLFIFVVCIMRVISGTYNPFIYFQF